MNCAVGMRCIYVHEVDGGEGEVRSTPPPTLFPPLGGGPP